MSEKILIIDDEQDIADLLEVYLKNENYVVYKFYCATDAMYLQIRQVVFWGLLYIRWQPG